MVKWVKLDEDAILPVRATEYSAGYDLWSNETVVIPVGGVVIVKTGITFEGLATNKYIQISLRSGTSVKRPLLMANGVGVVDSDYEGNEIGIILYNRGNIPVTIDKYERLAQAVILNYNLSVEKKVTTKRSGGFGSTGDK